MPISGPLHAINFQSSKAQMFERPENLSETLAGQGFSANCAMRFTHRPCALRAIFVRTCSAQNTASVH
jgi:hypothetical protein